jgi:hypothetical protein
METNPYIKYGSDLGLLEILNISAPIRPDKNGQVISPQLLAA